jgi:alpha-tubulin suppressor-like RCC1 family protein
VAAGRWHSLGLKKDGSIVAWGGNSDGQCDVPEPNTNFIAVAAGWWHSLGLKKDGSIVAGGNN